MLSCYELRVTGYGLRVTGYGFSSPLLFSSYRPIVLSFYRSTVLPFYRSTVLSFYRSIVLSSYRSIVLPSLCSPPTYYVLYTSYFFSSSTTYSLFYPGVFLHLIIRQLLMLNLTPFANIDCSPVLIQNWKPYHFYI